MVNVRQCILSGSFHHTPMFISALFDFLTRQPLRELNVNLWTEVSAVTILRFLTIAPVVSFRQVVINQDLSALSDHSQHTPKVEDLFIDRSAPQIHELLAQPQFKSFTGTLRHLFVSSLSGVELLVATAPMLEHLHLGVGTSFYPPLERVLSSPTSSFHSRLCLAAAPQTQCCCPTSILRLRLIPDARVFDGGSIWKNYRNEAVRAEILARFAEAAETGMPKAHGERRLVLETYVHGREQWRRSTGKFP
ncbi:hypothetical protein B0H14DRAFT_2781196 [Mycena olivaceomarginata]|nr:hypothetical protein B0H14DRAFT_2781196 [Mycena olivaceomarginata]